MPRKQVSSYSHYIHRTSYSFQEKLVGVFVLSALVILLAVLFSLLRKQHFFEEYFVLYARVQSAAGLSTETSVQISGFEVGSVSNIEITEKNDILLTLSILQRYRNLIRTDSVAKISSLNATILGKSIVEITAGAPQLDVVSDGKELLVIESASIDTVIAKAQGTLQTVERMIENISELVASIDVQDVHDTVASMNHMAANLSAMSDHIVAGKGGVGSLLYDEKLEQTFEQGIANLERATLRLDDMMKKINRDSDKLPEMLDDVQAVIDETRQTIEATQRIWPISSAIGKPENKPLLVDPMPVND